MSQFFFEGARLSNPFKTKEVQEKEIDFIGKKFPTYFKFKGKSYGTKLYRECPINMRCRMIFETDVSNDYFVRDIDPGEKALYIIKKNSSIPVETFTINLQNGIATLNLTLPKDSKVNETLQYSCVVSDCTQVESFKNNFTIKVRQPAHIQTGTGKRRKPPGRKPGVQREIPLGIEFPDIYWVEEKDWERQTPPFNKYTAIRVYHVGSDKDSDTNSINEYEFYVNRDNIYLNSEIKASKTDADVLRARFMYGLCLIGMSLIQQDITQIKDKAADDSIKETDDEESSITDTIEFVSTAVAPVILPMIESLSFTELEYNSSLIA